MREYWRRRRVERIQKIEAARKRISSTASLTFQGTDAVITINGEHIPVADIRFTVHEEAHPSSKPKSILGGHVVVKEATCAQCGLPMYDRNGGRHHCHITPRIYAERHIVIEPAVCSVCNSLVCSCLE